MKRNRAPLAAAGLMLFLAACAAPSPKVGKDTKIPDKFGVVALTAQNNVMGGSLGESYLFEWKHAFIKRLGKGQQGSPVIELLSRKEGMRDSIVFFATVSPGTYSLQTLSSSTGVGRYYETRFREEFQFTVKANRITNLGTVISAIAPKEGFTQDVNIYRGVLPSDAEMSDYLRGAFPAMLAQQQGEPFQTWVNPEIVAKTAEVASRIRRFSTGMTTPARAKDGTYYAGAPMGMVWRRSAKGEWSSLDTGYAREITAVGTLADGGILAAAEGGVLLHSTDRGESWKNMGPLPRYGLVLATGQFGKGKLYAVVNEGRVLSLLLADRADGPWESVKTFMGPLTGAMGLSPKIDASVVQAGTKLAVVIKNRELKVYDSATGAWTQQSLPSDAQRTAGFEDGTVFVAHELPPAPANKANKADKADKTAKTVSLRRTVDGGATWQEVAAYDPDMQSFALFSPTTLVRKTDVTPAVADAIPVEHDLAYSSDGGKTWTDTTREKRYYLPAQGGMSGDRMLLFYGLNAVSSADKGKTWKREAFIFPNYKTEARKGDGEAGK